MGSHNMGIIMTEESSSQSFNHTEKKKNYFGVDREQDTSDKQKINVSSSSSKVTDATANQGLEKPIGNGQVGNERFIPLLITNRPYENDTIIEEVNEDTNILSNSGQENQRIDGLFRRTNPCTSSTSTSSSDSEQSDERLPAHLRIDAVNDRHAFENSVLNDKMYQSDLNEEKPSKVSKFESNVSFRPDELEYGVFQQITGIFRKRKGSDSSSSSSSSSESSTRTASTKLARKSLRKDTRVSERSIPVVSTNMPYEYEGIYTDRSQIQRLHGSSNSTFDYADHKEKIPGLFRREIPTKPENKTSSSESESDTSWLHENAAKTTRHHIPKERSIPVVVTDTPFKTDAENTFRINETAERKCSEVEINATITGIFKRDSCGESEDQSSSSLEDESSSSSTGPKIDSSKERKISIEISNEKTNEKNQ